MEEEKKKYKRADRYNKVGMTAAHEHLVELHVAFGDAHEWKGLIHDTQLLSSEPAFPLKNWTYIADRKDKLNRKKKQGKLKNPQFDSGLIYGTFKSSAYINQLAEIAKAPPTRKQTTTMPKKSRSDETILSYDNEDGELDVPDDADKARKYRTEVAKGGVNDATNALAKLDIDKESTPKLVLKSSYFTLFQGVNPHDLQIYEGGLRDAEDGSGKSESHMQVKFYPKSIKDLDHVSLSLYYTKGHAYGTSILKFTYPAISYADPVDSLNFLAKIGATSEKEIDAGSGSTAEKAKKKNAVKLLFHQMHRTMKHEISKGFGADVNLPILKSTYIATPRGENNKRVVCHNTLFQGSSNHDMTFLKMKPNNVDFDEEENGYGQKADGTCNYVYWDIPYIGDSTNELAASPKKPTAANKTETEAFLTGLGI